MCSSDTATKLPKMTEKSCQKPKNNSSFLPLQSGPQRPPFSFAVWQFSITCQTYRKMAAIKDVTIRICFLPQFISSTGIPHQQYGPKSQTHNNNLIISIIAIINTEQYLDCFMGLYALLSRAANGHYGNALSHKK